MAGLLLYKNALIGSTISGPLEAPNTPYQNTIDGRLDTVGRSIEAGTINFDLAEPTDIDAIAIYAVGLENTDNPTAGFVDLINGSGTQRVNLPKISGVVVLDVGSVVAGVTRVRLAIDDDIGSPPIHMFAAGKSLRLGPDCQNFALRAPYSPAGVYQTLKADRNISNSEYFLPQSYRVEAFDVNLNFKYVPPATMHAELQNGLYTCLQREAVFLCWDVDFDSSSTYPQVAVCWADKTINPPRFPDHNRLYDWSVRLMGRSE